MLPSAISGTFPASSLLTCIFIPTRLGDLSPSSQFTSVLCAAVVVSDIPGAPVVIPTLIMNERIWFVNHLKKNLRPTMPKVRTGAAVSGGWWLARTWCVCMSVHHVYTHQRTNLPFGNGQWAEKSIFSPEDRKVEGNGTVWLCQTFSFTVKKGCDI